MFSQMCLYSPMKRVLLLLQADFDNPCEILMNFESK